MRSNDNLIYISDRCYQRQTILLDVEVIEKLTSNKLSIAEQINNILREHLNNEK